MTMQIAHLVPTNCFAAVLGDHLIHMIGEPMTFVSKADLEEALSRRGLSADKQVRQVKRLTELDLPAAA